MSEEKGLQEADMAAEEGIEDLSSFVDLADLDELEYKDNEDVFGGLGDIADLGEMPDLSLDAVSDSQEAAGEVSIPDLIAEEPEEVSFQTVEPAEDVSLPDLTEEEAGSMPDLLMEDEEVPMPSLDDMTDGEVPMPESESVDMADFDSGGTMPSLDEMADTGSEEMMPSSDDMADIADDGMMPSLDDMADAGSEEPLLSLDGMADMEPDGDVAGEEDSAMPDIGLLDAIGDEAVDSSVLDALDDLDGGTEEPILDDAVSDILAGGDGIGGLDLGFSDGGEAAPAVEESGGSGLDSMLGGLLNNLDMNGSISDSLSGGEDSIGMDASPIAMDDLDELSDAAEDMLDVAGMVPEAVAPEQKEPGLLKRVFGNVVTDEIAEQERMAAQQEEEDAAKRAEEEEKAKEEAAVKKEEKKAEKAAKKEEKKKQKEAKKAEKAAKKEEKKKQKEEEEAAELEIVGKLNKVGVSIIVIATILFLAVEITGTNLFGYISTKNKAVDYFEMGKYTQAYQEAIGTNMSEKDKEEYDKIKVVMKVQQALNAYQNYDRVSYYPEALDALLRGLKRYDANIDKGIELEVDSDMMSCRKQILTLLQSEFNLSESDAYSILAMDSENYQKKVVELGLKKK
ncbi:hypothetical protein D7V86_21795 [bacterium D16-51]|nr:hypothetical protein D7V96_22465 [bacterium D16-59]RKI55372.1 hypothetical protein D7V86_21795 [bacterium D16-51]